MISNRVRFRSTQERQFSVAVFAFPQFFPHALYGIARAVVHYEVDEPGGDAAPGVGVQAVGHLHLLFGQWLQFVVYAKLGDAHQPFFLRAVIRQAFDIDIDGAAVGVLPQAAPGNEVAVAHRPGEIEATVVQARRIGGRLETPGVGTLVNPIFVYRYILEQADYAVQGGGERRHDFDLFDIGAGGIPNVDPKVVRLAGQLPFIALGLQLAKEKPQNTENKNFKGVGWIYHGK